MPSKRFSHSSTIMDGYLYLFGGTNIPEEEDNVSKNVFRIFIL